MEQIVRRPAIRPHRLIALLGVLVAALACLPAAASAAEVGLNVVGMPAAGSPAAGYMTSLRPAWQREWLLWDNAEPARGAINSMAISNLAASAAAARCGRSSCRRCSSRAARGERG
jgi:hypothetical protein